MDHVDPEDLFEVASLGSEEPRLLPTRILSEIIEPRMQELFVMVQQEIARSGYENLLPGGIVLSGGGSQLLGSAELCRQVTGLPTRLGSPYITTGMAEELRSPVYSTAVGLVQYGAHHHQQIQMTTQDNTLLGRFQRWSRHVLSRLFSS